MKVNDTVETTEDADTYSRGPHENKPWTKWAETFTGKRFKVVSVVKATKDRPKLLVCEYEGLRLAHPAKSCRVVSHS